MAPYVVLAFVVSDPQSACTPSWGAAYSLDDASDALDLDRRIALLRQRGGDVMVSFGGQANSELAVGCTSQDDLVHAYEDVIKRYHLKSIDLDIEGGALADADATKRRNAAIAQVQKDTGVKVWVTVPVARTGLTGDGLSFVTDTLDSGVDLAGVNLMTMDYGDVPAGVTMGTAAVSALDATHAQLAALYRQQGRQLSAVDVCQRMGATVMLGQNDIAGEVFTLDDAATLQAFASQHKLGRVAMWSLNRDRACGDNYPDVTIVSDACSGVKQDAGAFAEALGGTGTGDVAGIVSDSASATTTPSVDPTVTPSDNPATSPYPIWQQDQVYLEGTRVVWHHNVYVAKWWTSGDVPDNPLKNGDATPWTLIGPVLPGESPEPTPTMPADYYPTWKITKAYHAGDRVLFEGVPYVAQWWTQGDSPATPGTVNAPAPWRPLTEQEITAALNGSASPSATPAQQAP